MTSRPSAVLPPPPPNSGLFVLWMHLDSFKYSYRYAGIATSPSPVGPFEWKWALHPNGFHSYDINLFQEPGSSTASQRVDRALDPVRGQRLLLWAV